MAKRFTPEAIEADLDALQAMDAKMLRKRWEEVFKSDPPPKMQARFLRLAIAYRIQEKAFGGLTPAVLRQLRRHARAVRTPVSDDRAASNPVTIPRFDPQTSLSPGTRLMREWNGTTELVDVMGDGFMWRGKQFRTLSAVAGAITGTKWSGPKFFGLLRTPFANGNKVRVQRGAPALLQDEAA